MKRPRRSRQEPVPSSSPNEGERASGIAVVHPYWSPDRRRDIELASKRLGSSDDRCRWLLDDFTARDPDTLSTAERALWRDNLVALAVGERPGGGWRYMTFYEREPLREELRGLWERVTELTNSHHGSVTLPSLAGFIGRVERDSESAQPSTPYVRLARGYRADDFEAALLHAVADLLISCERLRECPEEDCKRLFVATRRQERHPKCAQRARDRKRLDKKKSTKLDGGA